ncbi:NADPH:quinone reductase [Hydrogenophaga sp. PBL-H3]|uniref:NADPH:quinone reductase n=1 Tax=Hydrogenophaga sp. PBL-H3 TaxID=434010 RepID=UPI00131FE343|nr:NADPH:quinone reductase [Hydrogenophaga sp. PBL-H3]QHE78028.1 NADPH:quinone reductase [Hydrogenophaga sp. PBL-H3]QHE82452.1 NADPH:quinone reductase [Hydrogenophaga sp. PBL-H3]
MKAAWYRRNGSARDVLEVGELPTPQPGPGEVRVRLHTSGVNPSDVKSRLKRPLIAERIVPHSDGAGIIDAVGDGVPASRVGERVWLWNAQWQRPMGTACECVALPAQQAVALPDEVDFDAAACFGIPALTAIQAVHLAGPLQGKTVLVTGAGNAVGHFVTQLAVLQGATVIGTAGAPARQQHARDAGALHVIDYQREPVAARVAELTQGRGADVVIDMDFSSTAALLPQKILRPHGRLACYGSNQPGEVVVDFRTLLFDSLQLVFFVVYELLPHDRASAIQALTALLRAGQLRHTVGQTFALDDIAAAHEAVEAGRVVGNVVIRI